MDKEILSYLKKILPKLLSNPEIMLGYDIASSEIDYVSFEQKIPLAFLENLGEDHFFLICCEDFELTDSQDKKIDEYFAKQIRNDFNSLLDYFDFLENS